ncbi:site-specific integrase [Picrophilus oshimae]|uniref:DNA integration/recombination/invertion protein n=1 Tax=Picrophilus torridus (strain ATCC 700027 / DSM 9790 / JCM 10055 / NBRC 100828 / KAW 2/3) TaxID=1122961 RepID=Q6L255_PICTO|nr:site-specific integrase [Picrophilus oshimae]AAT42947.1 DNA integration/recombination/invertion protein [Picrophilus oshimae DSM 9789]
MDYTLSLNKEIKKLDEIGLNKNSCEKIKEFIDDLTFSGISDGRKYAYIIRLRKIALMLNDKFLNPDKKDIKMVISKIMNSSVKWGGSEHKPSDNAIESYYVTLKKFYKWLLGNNKTYPECVDWIKFNSRPSHEVKPESLITVEEEKKLINACRNSRDRALISLLYDSGCRISELLTMKIKDLRFDDYGAVISVTGKTGFREVRIIGNSIYYLKEYLNDHPLKDLDSWLFIMKNNERMSYDEVRSMILKAKKRSGITRRIYPHLFRHTRATILASKVAEAPLESQMGWVHGSRQTRTYIHLSMRDQDNAILEAYGIKTDDKKIIEPMPKKCPRCNSLNPEDAKYCHNCWLPFDEKLALEYENKEKQIEAAIERSEIIPGIAKKMIENAPESFKSKLIENVLEEILKDPELLNKFRSEIGK